MAPPNRTTPEQLEWLNSLKTQFSEHQKEKTLADFWSNLDRDWFTRWPEPGVAEAEHEPEGHPLREKATEALSCRKSYLRNWFNNRSANKRKAPLKAQPQITISRSHQPVEIYSKQFYKEKVKPLVATELAENEVPKKEKLAVVKNLTKAAFDAEPEDVREAIFAQAKALKAENAARRADAKKSEGHLSPEGYATAIESVAYVLDSFIRDLSMRTGWAFSVLGGGPDPVNGGRIQTISFHEGRNFLGATFKKAHVSFDENVLKPYVEFLNQVYPPAVCEARALSDSVDDPLNSPMNDHSNLARSHTPEAPATSNIPGTDEPTMNESGPSQTPNTLAQGLNTAQDMSDIDPQLRPPSTHSTGVPVPIVNSPNYNFPPTPIFAPQAEIGSAVSALVAPQLQDGPPTLPIPSPALTSTSPAHPPLSGIPPALPVAAASQAETESAISALAIPQLLGGSPTPPLLSSALTTSSSPPHAPLSGAPPVPPASAALVQPRTSNAAPVKKARRRPGVRPMSALQKVAEKAIADKAVVTEKETTWSNDLIKAVKVAEARAVKAAEAKATKAAKAAEAKAAKAAKAAEAAAAAEAAEEVAAASVSPPDISNIPAVPTVLQPGRSQRVRKAATSKEVVPLVDKRKRQDSKENDAGPKKLRVR